MLRLALAAAVAAVVYLAAREVARSRGASSTSILTVLAVAAIAGYVTAFPPGVNDELTAARHLVGRLAAAALIAVPGLLGLWMGNRRRA